LKQTDSDSFFGGIIKSMGLVFGDIGTSPIDTLTVIFAGCLYLRLVCGAGVVMPGRL
jgi:K+ transporter